MASTYTVNKGIEQPSAGSYNNTWASPVNADWEDIDNALGGSTTITVTGIAAGVYTLSLTQYQPPNIVFNGALSASLVYALPVGVGWIGTVFNNTSGAFSLIFASNGGGSLTLAQGQRSMIVCDGANVQLADTQANASGTAAAAAAQAAAQAFATAADAVVTTNTEAFATTAANNAQSAAQSYAAGQAAAAQAAAQAFATAADAVVLTTADNFATTSISNTIKSGTFTCLNGIQTVTFSTPFITLCSSVSVQWEYVGPNVGWVVPGSRTVNGFQYQNGNSGTCSYVAIGR